ncbi:MAG: prephenate dehydrogenase [Oscillospiraceae bacterium]|nr:prephenate dehydrogenase [Oscillospiraceae bacterium]
MNIGVVGLGLIGASLAKSIKKNTSHTVFGLDKDKSTLDFALLGNTVDCELKKDNLKLCDYVFIAVYPQGTIDFVKENKANFKSGATVIDCGGIKRDICRECFLAANDGDFSFIGGHPMAGTQFSGIKYAKDTMFHNASFVLTPKTGEAIETVSNARDLIIEIGFSRVTVMSPEEHDRRIAFTSQLAHIVSNAYVKSPAAKMRSGISAGSYKDLTRVAYLNENMWTELFMDNKDNLCFEIDNLIAELKKYSDAMKENDSDALKKLLKDGREIKEEIG